MYIEIYKKIKDGRRIMYLWIALSYIFIVKRMGGDG